jgi:endonuclease/exonuclease/phosphatase family metal-dependent hydrolase
MHRARFASIVVLLAAFAAVAFGQEPPPEGRAAGAYGSQSSAGQSSGGPAGDMVIMSFNIRYGTASVGENAWPLRRALVWNVIRNHRPDVVGLQEALRFQLDELGERLPGYAEIGVGRADGATKGEYAAILFRTARFRADEAGTFWLSDTPEKPGSKSWGNEIHRICTWAHFIDKQTHRSFYLYNTHLDHQSQPSRERGIELIAARIATRTHRNDPVMITGDFNAGEDNTVIRFAKGEIPRASKADERPITPMRLIDTFRVAHPDAEPVGTFHGFRGGRGGPKIDYVFADPNITVREGAILYDNTEGRYPSDHYPVMARVNLSPDETDTPSEEKTGPGAP